MILLRKIGKAILMTIFFFFILFCGGGNKPYISTSVCREITFEKNERRTVETRKDDLQEIADQNLFERIDQFVQNEIF